jgi:hypothetical protein
MHTGKDRASRCCRAPEFLAVSVLDTLLAVVAGSGGAATIEPAAVEVALALILHGVTARRCRTQVARTADAANAVALLRAAEIRAALGAAGRATAVDTTLALILRGVGAARNRAAQCARAIVNAPVTGAICGYAALLRIRALVGASTSAVGIRFIAIG